MLKCSSYNCNSVRNNSECVKNLLKISDVVLLQELMLSKSDLPYLENFDKNFEVVAFVRDREREGINEGRPSRGVAIFWRRQLAKLITPIKMDDSMIAVIFNDNGEKIMMMNIYMPCDKQNFNSLDEQIHFS